MVLGTEETQAEGDVGAQTWRGEGISPGDVSGSAFRAEEIASMRPGFGV